MQFSKFGFSNFSSSNVPSTELKILNVANSPPNSSPKSLLGSFSSLARHHVHFDAQKSTQFIPTAPHHVNMKLLVPVLVALAAIDCSVGSEAEEATRYVRSQSAGKVRGVAADEDRKLMFTTAAVDHKAPKQEHKPSSPSSPTYDHKPVTSPKDYPSPTHEVRRDRAMNRSAGTLRMTERHVARPNTITHSLSVTNLSVS